MGWLQAPENPRDLAAWRYHRWSDAGWIMSLLPADVDGDQDLDVLFSDRKGPRSGVWWCENPGTAHQAEWTIRAIGGGGREVMFLDVGRLDEEHEFDIVVADRRGGLIWFWQGATAAGEWRSRLIAWPAGVRCNGPTYRFSSSSGGNNVKRRWPAAQQARLSGKS